MKEIIEQLLKSDYISTQWVWGDSDITEFHDDDLRIVVEELYGSILMSIDSSKLNRKTVCFPLHFLLPISEEEQQLIKELTKKFDLSAYSYNLPMFEKYGSDVAEKFWKLDY